MTDCNGDGACLMGLQRGGGRYDISNCIHNCMPVKCPNFLVCGHISPKCMLDINYGTCLTCRVSFNNRLEFSRAEKCVLCEETNISVKRLMCEHKVCTSCFKKIHFNKKINSDNSSVCNICGIPGY